MTETQDIPPAETAGTEILAGVEVVDLAAKLARPQRQFYAFPHGQFSNFSTDWAGV